VTGWRRLAVPLAMVAIGVGALVGDRLTAPAQPAFHPPRAAVQLRKLLRTQGMDALACGQDAGAVTCTLPGGAHCTQTVGGNGACVDASGRTTLILGSGILVESP